MLLARGYIVAPDVILDSTGKWVPEELWAGGELGPFHGLQHWSGEYVEDLGCVPDGARVGIDGHDPDLVAANGYVGGGRVFGGADSGDDHARLSGGFAVDMDPVRSGSLDGGPAEDGAEREGRGIWGRESQSGKFDGTHVDDGGSTCDAVITIEQAFADDAALIEGECGGGTCCGDIQGMFVAAAFNDRAGSCWQMGSGGAAVVCERTEQRIDGSFCCEPADQIAAGVGGSAGWYQSGVIAASDQAGGGCEWCFEFLPDVGAEHERVVELKPGCGVSGDDAVAEIDGKWRGDAAACSLSSGIEYDGRLADQAAEFGCVGAWEHIAVDATSRCVDSLYAIA